MSERKTIDFFINGEPAVAYDGETVIQAARRAGVDIPHFCWHPELSVPGNCRICMVEVEQEKGDPWFDIGCNMPVTAGMRVLTESETVKKLRRDTMQFITLNHPVDCGICSKSGECTLQDYHYEHNGRPSLSIDRKNHATKFYPLSDRIMLDNERCIMCTRCVRFTHEVSQSKALAAVHRGDQALIRPAEDANFNTDAYSDNVIDICPVGALLSRKDLSNARVWYTESTPSVCPGCARGCTIDIWHRKASWKFTALDPQLNTRIERVTPRETPEVNGPWICNKARDLSALLERPRAMEALVAGRPVPTPEAVVHAAALLAGAQRPLVLVSSWASNEELAAFQSAFGERLGRSLTAVVKADHQPQPGEVEEDAILIVADKNPNTRGAMALFPAWDGTIPPATDLVVVWGEGGMAAALPAGLPVIRMSGYAASDNAEAAVFLPLSIQIERDGSYTNIDGVVNSFRGYLTKAPAVLHAIDLFPSLAAAQPPVLTGRAS
jgi:NADH-quinone oxidoreductase subunit G